MQRPAPQEIARRAYELWERGGRIHGLDQQYWFKAERELLGAATAAEDRPIDEGRSAEPVNSPIQSSAPKTPVSAEPPATATAEQDRPIGDVRLAQQAGAKRATPPEPDPLIKASRRAGAESDDLAAQMAELQRLMTKSKPAVKSPAKPRAKKPAGEADDPASRDRK